MNQFLNQLTQIAAVTKFALLTLPQRKGASLAAAFGIAGVVAVLVGVLSIAQGFRHAVTSSGSKDTAIVLRSGADNEMMSSLAGDEARIIADAPGVARSPEGALASPELFVVINLPKRSTGTDANVPLRGVSLPAFQVREGLRLLAGRRFQPGRNEIVVGRGAAREFAGLDLGATLKIGRFEWEVVGVFAANGGVAESEIWTDAAVLQPAYQRGNSYQAVYAKLESEAAFERFKDALTTDPRLNVKVVRETEYYAAKSATVYALVRGLGFLVGGMMALGAVFGALNTMYTAVAARTREIATLRALGFGSAPVVISILAEAVLLACAGGAVGAAAAYFALDGFQTATLNWDTFSQITFAFRVTFELLVLGVVLAVSIGLFGGILPAIRAARLPVADALRAL